MELNLKRILEVLSLILLPIMIMCIIAGDQIVEIFYEMCIRDRVFTVSGEQ